MPCLIRFLQFKVGRYVMKDCVNDSEHYSEFGFLRLNQVFDFIYKAPESFSNLPTKSKNLPNSRQKLSRRLIIEKGFARQSNWLTALSFICLRSPLLVLPLFEVIYLFLKFPTFPFLLCQTRFLDGKAAWKHFYGIIHSTSRFSSWFGIESAMTSLSNQRKTPSMKVACLELWHLNTV